MTRPSQLLDYAFGLLYMLLAVRLVLVLFNANPASGFTRFIDVATNPFYEPFRGIVPSQSFDGGYTLAIPLMIALLIYAFLHVAINKFLRMFVRRGTAS